MLSELHRPFPDVAVGRRPDCDGEFSASVRKTLRDQESAPQMSEFWRSLFVYRSVFGRSGPFFVENSPTHENAPTKTRHSGPDSMIPERFRHRCRKLSATVALARSDRACPARTTPGSRGFCLAKRVSAALRRTRSSLMPFWSSGTRFLVTSRRLAARRHCDDVAGVRRWRPGGSGRSGSGPRQGMRLAAWSRMRRPAWCCRSGSTRIARSGRPARCRPGTSGRW